MIRAQPFPEGPDGVKWAPMELPPELKYCPLTSRPKGEPSPYPKIIKPQQNTCPTLPAKYELKNNICVLVNKFVRQIVPVADSCPTSKSDDDDDNDEIPIMRPIKPIGPGSTAPKVWVADPITGKWQIGLEPLIPENNLKVFLTSIKGIRDSLNKILTTIGEGTIDPPYQYGMVVAQNEMPTDEIMLLPDYISANTEYIDKISSFLSDEYISNCAGRGEQNEQSEQNGGVGQIRRIPRPIKPIIDRRGPLPRSKSKQWIAHPISGKWVLGPCTITGSGVMTLVTAINKNVDAINTILSKIDIPIISKLSLNVKTVKSSKIPTTSVPTLPGQISNIVVRIDLIADYISKCNTGQVDPSESEETEGGSRRTTRKRSMKKSKKTLRNRRS